MHGQQHIKKKKKVMGPCVPQVYVKFLYWSATASFPRSILHTRVKNLVGLGTNIGQKFRKLCLAQAASLLTRTLAVSYSNLGPDTYFA